MAKHTGHKINEDELWQAAEDAARPIDFEALIAAGIIEKDGEWYRVLKPLPRHAERKIQKRKYGPKGLRVKFRAPRRDIVNLVKNSHRRSPT